MVLIVITLTLFRGRRYKAVVLDFLSLRYANFEKKVWRHTYISVKRDQNEILLFLHTFLDILRFCVKLEKFNGTLACRGTRNNIPKA
jgi:hypothetical protein